MTQLRVLTRHGALTAIPLTDCREPIQDFKVRYDSSDCFPSSGISIYSQYAYLLFTTYETGVRIEFQLARERRTSRSRKAGRQSGR
ncbi:hypothetical protein E2C01_074430 [Portunus trituberculatus]|uniref:Uncharacterized protein n=1 Tax=Portunus trituberculatus TaxID=210409 RepID=A0A5B7IEA2_PORTR|nr:hypothetical protein [Portunus trituberculatus]